MSFPELCLIRLCRKNPQPHLEDELIITFRKPFDFEGETFRELDLHGLEDLRGRDLTAIEKAFNKTGVSSFVPESTTTYAKIVATKVTGLPAEFFEDLPVGEIEKIKNAVVASSWPSFFGRSDVFPSCVGATGISGTTFFSVFSAAFSPHSVPWKQKPHSRISARNILIISHRPGSSHTRTFVPPIVILQ